MDENFVLRSLDEGEDSNPDAEMYRAQAQYDLAEAALKRQMFDTESWNEVRSEWWAQYQDLSQQLLARTTDTYEKVERIRGQMDALAWVLNYPDLLKSKMSEARAILARVGAAEGE